MPTNIKDYDFGPKEEFDLDNVDFDDIEIDSIEDIIVFLNKMDELGVKITFEELEDEDIIVSTEIQCEEEIIEPEDNYDDWEVSEDESYDEEYEYEETSDDWDYNEDDDEDDYDSDDWRERDVSRYVFDDDGFGGEEMYNYDGELMDY